MRIGKRTFTHFVLVCVILLGFLPFLPNIKAVAQAVSGRLAWSDEFGQKASRWAWDYNSGTGYKKLVQTSGAATAVECGITSASTSTNYSDCSLHEKSFNYTTGIVEMRLRTTDDNGISQPGQGTRGWGFWDGGPNAAWFWSASRESDSKLAGFRIQVVRDNSLRFNQTLSNFDMRQWHVYRVELQANSTRFFVDNVLIASTAERPNKNHKIYLWIDNYKMMLTPTGYTTSYLKVNQNQKMYIDWVRYYELTSGLVVNHSFEVDKNSDSLPDGWDRTLSGSNDKRISAAGANGSYVYQMSSSNSTTAFKSANQSLNQSGKAGSVWQVAVWSRTANNNPPGSLRIRIEFKNSSGGVQSASKALTKNAAGIYQAVSLTAPQDYASLKIFLESSVTQGNVYFDNVTAVRK